MNLQIVTKRSDSHIEIKGNIKFNIKKKKL
jgi:hypothetical protein